MIPVNVTGIPAEPTSQSHFSDIWSGTLDGRRVAIKALRLHEDERDQVKKVRVLWPMRPHTTCLRRLGLSSRARYLAILASS
jgi:hypothetical protein